MFEPVKWGILGTATIARKCVIPALQLSDRTTVQVLGSRDPDAAQDLVREHKIPALTQGYDAVVNSPEVEAIYVPLPNHLHREWVLKALAAGKHVLCEKPIACNAGEAREMALAAQAAGRHLMEGFMYRFHPRSLRLKQLVADGHIGSLKIVRAAFCYHMADREMSAGANFRLRPESGGGALMDVGCYGVSTARWFFDQEPIAVQAQADYHANGVDVHFVGTLKFNNGGLAVIEASFTSALQQTYTLVGDRAVVELPHDAYIPWEKDAIYHIRGQDQETGQTITIDGADEYRLMLEHFSNAVRSNTNLDDSIDDSIQNMRVLDALAEAARSGQTVQLKSG